MADQQTEAAAQQVVNGDKYRWEARRMRDRVQRIWEVLPELPPSHAGAKQYLEVKAVVLADVAAELEGKK